MLKLIFLNVLLVVAAQGRVVLLDEPIAGNGGIRPWRHRIQNLAEGHIRAGQPDPYGYTECVEVKEIPGLILCGSYLQETMNRVFLRASIYSEGGLGHEAGEVMTTQEPGFKQGVLLIKGHDIPGSNFEGFLKAVGTRHLTKPESELVSALNPLRGKYGEYVLISFSVQNVNDFRTVTSHEGVHAQYFLDASFRRIVDLFWRNDLREEQRGLARKILGDLGYATSDEALMANECAAYLLEIGAMEPEGRFYPMGNQPRDLLIQRFEESGHPVILLE